MRSIRNLAFIGVSLMALASPAQAQEAAGEEDIYSTDIIVQARRRDEGAQDVPVVVNAVTADAIEKLNLRKFEDITSVVPGLALRQNTNGIGVTATVRGVNYDVNVSGNNGTIAFYQNDVPIPAGMLFNAMFDVGQIEVLRGPQGTLKGRSSPSGSITLYTRRPDLSQAGGFAQGTVNDINGFNLNGAINVPVIGDKFGVRIAGVVTEGRGNRVRDLVNTATPNDDTLGIRASAKADPFEGLLELDFAYQNISRDTLQFAQHQSVNQLVSGAAASPVTITAKDRLSAVGSPGTNNQSFTTYDWQAKLRLYGQALTYVGGDSSQHLLSLGAADAAGVFANDFSPTGVYFGQPTDTKSDNSSHEIRLQNEERIAGMFDYVVGYLHATGSSDTIFKSVTGIALAPPFAPAPRLINVALTPINRFGSNKENSIFGNITAHIGDATEISGGLRHISYKDNSGLAINGVINPLFSRDVSESKTVYQFSVKHNFSDDLMVYASTGSSWRPSTIAIGGPTANLSALQASYLATPPETSESYELGMKSDFLDETLRFNLTGFYQKYKNYPYRSASGVYAIDRTNATPVVSAFNYVAGVPVKIEGFEAELAYRPNSNFSIGGFLSYSHGKISNGTVPCLDLNNDGLPDVVTTPPTLAQMEADVGAQNIGSCSSSARSSAAPPWAASLQSEYSHPVSDNMNAYIRGLFTWKGSSQNDPANAVDDISSYGILNLFAGLRAEDGGWELTLYGKNITNTFRVISRTNGPASTTLRSVPIGGGLSSSGSLSTTNYYGIGITEPQEFGINLRFAIGSR